MKFIRKLLPGLVIAGLLFVFYLVRSERTEIQEIPVKNIEEKAVPARIDSIIRDYNSSVTSLIDSVNTTGAAITIVHNGETKLLKCYGIKKKGSDSPVDPQTVFRLASVSKTFTGTLAGLLAKDSILPLKVKIKDIIPGFRLKDSVNTSDLNIGHILSHTSGLVPHAYDNMVEGGVEFREIMDSLHRVHISAPPGKLYGYQNVVFSLFDTVSFAATAKPYSELMNERIFFPLGMKNSSTGYYSFFNNPNRAFPHTSSGRLIKKRSDHKGYYITNPAAGVNSSISDMAKFLKAMLGNNPEIIDSSVINDILTPRIQSPLKWQYLRNWKRIESKQYAIGWRIIGAYGREFAYHGGYIRGYRSEILLCREENFGIAYLSNSPNAAGSMVIPLFLNLYFKEGIGN